MCLGPKRVASRDRRYKHYLLQPECRTHVWSAAATSSNIGSGATAMQATWSFPSHHYRHCRSRRQADHRTCFQTMVWADGASQAEASGTYLRKLTLRHTLTESRSLEERSVEFEASTGGEALSAMADVGAQLLGVLPPDLAQQVLFIA